MLEVSVAGTHFGGASVGPCTTQRFTIDEATRTLSVTGVLTGVATDTAGPASPHRDAGPSRARDDGLGADLHAAAQPIAPPHVP